MRALGKAGDAKNLPHLARRISTALGLALTAGVLLLMGMTSLAHARR